MERRGGGGGGLNREAGLINFPPLKRRFMVFFSSDVLAQKSKSKLINLLLSSISLIAQNGLKLHILQDPQITISPWEAP